MSDYNTLLAAIHALDPFDNASFCALTQYEDFECLHCEALDSNMVKLAHTPECPVTHLRNILNDAFGKPKEFIPEVGYQRPELEVSVCGDILTIKNVSDKDAVIPLNSEDKPFIKSPTDNGM